MTNLAVFVAMLVEIAFVTAQSHLCYVVRFKNNFFRKSVSEYLVNCAMWILKKIGNFEHIDECDK